MEATTPTCTIQNAVTGLCGAPAVATFTGRDGTVYAECTDHYMPTPTSRANWDTVAVGAKVRVHHISLTKIGKVTRVGRTRCTVEVPVYAGTRKATTKAIEVAIADVEVVA